MLQRIRDNASGPLAYAVVGLISLVFGVWGIGSYFTPSANPVVASVGDIKITRYQLQQTYNQRYRRLREVMGDRFDPDTFEPQQLRRSILQNLVRSAVLDQYAVNAGYRTTDQALLRVLTSNPRFQVDGKFSTQRYKAMLANAGMSPAVYEARLRRGIVSQQVRGGVTNSAFVAPPALKHAFGLLKQERKLAYLLFPASAYKDQVQLNDDEINAWYESHKDQYMRPERVKLAYVELERGALDVADDATTEKALRDLYEQYKARFSTPDQRDGRQIFVPVTGDSASQARSKIQAIARKLGEGQSFDDIAASAEAGVKVTQLESVTSRELPTDVANALFGVDVGQVSTPVRGDKGWYLLKATAETKGNVQPFSAPDVQKQLNKMARTQWRNKHFGELAERMETLAFQAPNSLETLSTNLGLKIQHTGWITRAEGQGLTQSDAVRQAAFSDAVLKKSLNSTAIQVDKNHRVVLRVAEHQVPQEQPLDEVRAKVEEHLTTEKAQQLAQQAAQAAKQKLTEGAITLKTIATESPASLKTPGYIGRTARQVPALVRQAVFALPTPETDQAVYTITSTQDGGSALIALQDVKTDVLSDEETIPKMFVRQKRAYVAQLEYAAFADYLNNHAEVELNKDQMNLQ